MKPAPTVITEVDSNVIRFQPRASAIGLRPSANPPRDICQILSLSKYEQPRASNERGGLPVSVSALIFTVTLAVVGAWIVFDVETRQACASVTMCSHASRAASF